MMAPFTFLICVYHWYYIRKCKDFVSINQSKVKTHLKNMIWSITMYMLYLRFMSLSQITTQSLLTARYLLTTRNLLITGARTAGVFTLANVWFYFVHRLLHTKRLYHLHIQHHTSNHPLTTFNCSWQEHLLLNIGTHLVPLIIIPLPYEISLLWSLLILHKSMVAHVGMNEINNHHTIHHENSEVNFGAKPFMDKLFGTFKQ